MSRYSFFSVKKKIFETDAGFSDQLFKDYMDKTMVSFSSGIALGSSPAGERQWHYQLEEQALSAVKNVKNALNYRIHVYAASELTRQVPGHWDSFYLDFRPADTEYNSSLEQAVVVEVERLKTVKRSSGRNVPPDYSFFKEDVDFSGEGQVSTSISSYFAKSAGGWCVFSSDFYIPSKGKSICKDTTGYSDWTQSAGN